MGYIINELFRFRMLMAGVYTGLAISSSYGFSVLTEHLREKYDFAQAEITTISTVGNCVGYLSFFAGMLFDFGGPKAVFPVAGFLGFTGYLLFGLALDDVIPLKREDKQKNMICFSIFNAILYLGCPAMDAPTLMPLMMNFPLQRGYMVIIQKTFSGLGTSVLMAYFNGFFLNVDDKANSNYAGYVYFVGAQILFCACVGAILIDFPPYVMSQFRAKRIAPREKKEREAALNIFMSQNAPGRRLYIGCALIGLNLIFLTVESILAGYLQITKSGFVAIAVITVVLVASFAILALPLQFLGKYTPTGEPHKKYPVLGWVPDPEGFDLDAMVDKMEAEEAAQLAAADGKQPENAEAEREPSEVLASGEGAKNNSTSGKKVDNDSNNNSLVPAAGNEIPKQEQFAEVLAQADLADNREEAQGTTAAVSAPVVKRKQTSVGDPQHDGSFWSHLKTIDLWLLWFTYFGTWGTGSIMQMNSSQMYRSKNYGEFDAARNTLYVALMGVGSAVGRATSGLADMQLQRLKAKDAKRLAEVGKEAFVPSRLSIFFLTTVFLPVGPFLMALAYLFFAFVPASALILPFLVGSIGIGLGWGLGSLAIRIMYANDVGKHYNFLFSSGFICTITLNRFMFGEMYDNQARKQETFPACNTPACIRDQMLILMAVDLVSTVTGFLVHYRFQKFVTRKRREIEEEEELEEVARIMGGNRGDDAVVQRSNGRNEPELEPFSPVEDGPRASSDSGKDHAGAAAEHADQQNATDAKAN